jgi:hypothetical protein
MSRQVANPRVLAMAHTLEQLARQDIETQDHIRRELRIADGYPTKTPGASLATASGREPQPHNPDCDGCDLCHPVTLTATERAADTRLRLEDTRTAINTHLTTIERTLDALARLYRQAAGTRVPAPVLRCDGRGLEGSDLLWTPHSRDPHNGWYSPHCADAADNSRLCPACRVREARWRRENNKQPRTSNAGVPGA